MKSALGLLLMPVAKWVPWWLLRRLESKESRARRKRDAR